MWLQWHVRVTFLRGIFVWLFVDFGCCNFDAFYHSFNWRGVWNKALSDFWCNVKFSLSFTTEYKEIWKENLVIYQKSLKAFLQAPLQLKHHLLLLVIVSLWLLSVLSFPLETVIVRVVRGTEEVTEQNFEIIYCQIQCCRHLFLVDAKLLRVEEQFLLKLRGSVFKS